jgi:hypothetical protein
MTDNELRELLIEILDVMDDLARTVQSITPPPDRHVAESAERIAREEAVRTGKPLPRKAPSLVEKVASLRERVRSLPSSDDSGA